MCDDSSSDLTTTFAQKWLKYNHYLFSSVEIFKNSKNLGINKNFIQAISKISTKNYKILGADDLFYKNNIFIVNSSSDLTFSPLIRYDGTNQIGSSSIQHLLIIQNYYYYKLLLKVKNIFNAPGSFIVLNLLQDEDLIKYLSNYTMLEDYPIWVYLFNKFNNLKVTVDPLPYIIYRVTSGISNKRNKSFDAFKIDEERFKKENGIPYSRIQRYLNPITYINIIAELFLIKPLSFFFKRVIYSNKVITDEVSKFQIYIRLIKKNVSFFQKNNL
jgi:hypothetical protein